jgi:hypothetical protein
LQFGPPLPLPFSPPHTSPPPPYQFNGVVDGEDEIANGPANGYVNTYADGLADRVAIGVPNAIPNGIANGHPNGRANGHDDGQVGHVTATTLTAQEEAEVEAEEDNDRSETLSPASADVRTVADLVTTEPLPGDFIPLEPPPQFTNMAIPSRLPPYHHHIPGNETEREYGIHR